MLEEIKRKHANGDYNCHDVSLTNDGMQYDPEASVVIGILLQEIDKLQKKSDQYKPKCKIKFRGRRIDNGEWIEGYYAYKDLTDEHFIIHPTFNAHSDIYTQYFTDYLVDPDTVSQYTGRKDESGNEVCE